MAVKKKLLEFLNASTLLFIKNIFNNNDLLDIKDTNKLVNKLINKLPKNKKKTEMAFDR